MKSKNIKDESRKYDNTMKIVLTRGQNTGKIIWEGDKRHIIEKRSEKTKKC